MRRKALCSSALVSLVLACSAVEDSKSAGEPFEAIPKRVASVTFAQLGNFSGNSVRIFGARVPAADGKYPCASDLDQCFNFDEDGSLLEGPIEGLCPSVNIPAGNWSFTYEIFTAADCTGDVLNAPGNENNFECYDSTDLATQENPNQSVDEELLIGNNTNYIVCLSDDAEKEWDFNSCLAEGDGVYNCCGDLTPSEVCTECNVSALIEVEGCDFDAVTCVISCVP